jgi:hypothetical protein
MVPVPAARFIEAPVFSRGHLLRKPQLKRLAVSYHVSHLSSPYVTTLIQDATDCSLLIIHYSFLIIHS